MADESVTGAADVMRLARAEAVDIINMKPQKFGGLANSTRVSAVAAAANLSVFPSSRMCSGVGVAAAAHLYAAMPEVEFEGEFVDGVLMAESDLLAKPIKVKDGMVQVPHGEGIGVKVSEEQIKRYSTEWIKIRA
jgi:L-alanine-DL-glutamate epimerase-like enolase superfamily enzyme